MGGEVDTAKIEKVVKQAVELHQAKCPAVRAVGDALQAFANQQREDMQALRDLINEKDTKWLATFQDTRIDLVRGDAEFKEHERRIKVVESKAETNETAIASAKQKALVSIIKVLIIFSAGSGVGAGVLQAIKVIFN